MIFMVSSWGYVSHASTWGWYTQNLPNGEDFRRGFNTLENATDQRVAIEQFFQQISATTDRVRFGRYGEVSARKKNGALAA
jgi:tRNA-dihydrouridine synthase